MRFFRRCLRAFLSGIILSVALSCRAQTPATSIKPIAVSVSLRDAGSIPLPVASPGPDTTNADPLQSLGEWAAWANLFPTGGTALIAQTDMEGTVNGWAVRRPGTLGVALTNTSDSSTRVRLEAELSIGLWRVEAALIPFPLNPSPIVPVAPDTNHLSDAVPTPTPVLTAPKAWRLEGIVRSSQGSTFKTILVPFHQTLLLRYTDVGQEANTALQKARAAVARSQNSVMRPRVRAALDQIGDTLSVLTILASRGDRDKIVKRMHTALLAVGKAQAIWRNWREPSLDEDDKTFDQLVTALSEVSCAACNLLPSQTVVTGADGKSVLRVSVTNAGVRTVPYIALGLAGDNEGEAAALKAFRSLAPGARVSADFKLPDPTSGRGVVQFLFGMGAAVVPASVGIEPQ